MFMKLRKSNLREVVMQSTPAHSLFACQVRRRRARKTSFPTRQRATRARKRKTFVSLFCCGSGDIWHSAEAVESKNSREEAWKDLTWVTWTYPSLCNWSSSLNRVMTTREVLVDHWEIASLRNIREVFTASTLLNTNDCGFYPCNDIK